MNAIQKNKNELAILCKKHKVSSLYAFGSVLTSNFKKDSDIDLLVNFNKVDLVTEKYLSNPYFIKSINKTKQLVYE